MSSRNLKLFISYHIATNIESAGRRILEIAFFYLKGSVPLIDFYKQLLNIGYETKNINIG